MKHSQFDFFEKKLLDFYHKAGRDFLPWRVANISAYEVWVSEIMLQQTQVTRVIEYYERFLQKYPTVTALADTSWEVFLPYYAGLGYYRRGRNMIAAAQKVVAEYDGEFPRDKKLLLSLPGVGDYTASAILSFAYNDNHLAWDTNLLRVVGRYFFGSKTFSFDREQFEKKFTSNRKQLNAAFMDFGSAICLSRPKCKICPLAQHCIYFSEDGAQEKPQKNGSAVNESKVNGKVVNWKNAQVFLWLHKDHVKYYSADPHTFSVFVLSSTYQSRAGIKHYFKETYNLDLAVRPPHKKILVNDIPTFFVNAQILLGVPKFTIFPKDVVKRYNDNRAYLSLPM